jgi:hypothetical protein
MFGAVGPVAEGWRNGWPGVDLNRTEEAVSATSWGPIYLLKQRYAQNFFWDTIAWREWWAQNGPDMRHEERGNELPQLVLPPGTNRHTTVPGQALISSPVDGGAPSKAIS